MEIVKSAKCTTKVTLIWTGVVFQLLKLASSASIDQLITSAAQSSNQFGLLYGHNSGDVLVELDIVLTRKQWEEVQLYRAGRFRHKRKAIRGSRFRWTGKTIPYEFQRGEFNNYEKDIILSGLDEWKQYTCVEFRPAGFSDRNKIVFQNGGGCASYVGMVGGAQAVTLGRGCRDKRVVVHEVGHAVGFQHEQTRPDRDEYVIIQNQNIPSNLLYNFNRYPVTSVNTFNVPYDYRSIMHYSSTAFSVNGHPTIIAKDRSFQNIMGQAKGLSFRDIKLANLMYQCSENCPRKNCPAEGFLGKDCQCYCPGNPVRVCLDDENSIVRSTTITTSKTTRRTRRTTARPITSRPVTRCRDLNYRCRYWKTQGECTRNKGFMGFYCKNSCDLCDETGGNKICEDLNQNCRLWQRRGFCTNNLYRTYLRNTCPSSCGVCSNSNTITTNTGDDVKSQISGFKDDTSKEDCLDNVSLCPKWAEQGYCTRSRSYMRNSCKKSCDVC